MKFRLLSSRTALRARVFRLMEEVWRGPGGQRMVRHTVAHPGAVAIAARDAQDRLLFIRQYRTAVRRSLLELPAGTLEPGERSLACAQRELVEETGFAARRWRRLGSVFTAPGFCSERIVLYLAWDLRPQRAAQDEDEAIRLAPLKDSEVRRAVAAGRICDAKSLSALLLMMQARPKRKPR